MDSTKEAESQEAIATHHDKAHVQRSSTSSIVSIRSLGSGSYATVDLVSMPVQGGRKLLVRKMLMADGSSNPTSNTPSPLGQPVRVDQALLPVLKPSCQQDWNREAAMHRECAQCPFVLQLLAAKRCRTGNLLLLLEYATQGSLTDVLVARKQELQLRQSASGGSMTLAATAAQGTDSGVVATTTVQQAYVQEPAEAVNESAAEAVDTEVEVLLPLAVEAVHLIEEDAAVVETLCDSATAVQLPTYPLLQQAHADTALPTYQHMQQPQQLQQQHLQLAVKDEPVLITLFEDASLAASEHAPSLCSDDAQCTMPNPSAATAAGDATAAVLRGLHPVSHGLSEESARFYAACILMALRTLHSRRILHRDIKPCNLLLFHDGYLKLADLGCCCQLPEGVSGARTRTGTAAYMAPEVVAGTEPYGYPVDMWSLGVVIWQMVAGSLPDWAQQQEHLKHEGVHYAPRVLNFPEHFSKDLCKLLDGLLHQDSLARLDIDAVKASAWFQGFDWQALQDKTMEPPSNGLVLSNKAE